MTHSHLELEQKWWHRLAKVLMWAISLVITIVSLFILALVVSEGQFEPSALLLVLPGPVTFIALWFIYKKIILYIAFGKRGESKINNATFKRFILYQLSALKRFKFVVIFILIFVLLGGFAFSKQKAEARLRDMRYDLYMINLRFANETKPNDYLQILSVNTYFINNKGKEITDSKLQQLRWISSDLYDLESSCRESARCRNQLLSHIQEMKTAVATMEEYYNNLGGADSEGNLYMRDQAWEINRAVRLKYLISPDPAIKLFTKDQVKQLVKAQWEKEFTDWIEFKKLCDATTPDAKESDFYTNWCSEDFFLHMLTFNFSEENAAEYPGLATVCDLEKNYLKTPKCDLTLIQSEAARKEYQDYLATHKNPYYNVSRFPEEPTEELTEESSSSIFSETVEPDAISETEMESGEQDTSSISNQTETKPAGMNAAVCNQRHGMHSKYNIQTSECECAFRFVMKNGKCVGDDAY